MVNDMVRANLLGIMDRSLTDSGVMAKRMVLVCGNHPREIRIKASGRITDKLAQASTFTLEVLSITVSSKIS